MSITEFEKIKLQSLGSAWKKSELTTKHREIKYTSFRFAELKSFPYSFTVAESLFKL